MEHLTMLAILGILLGTGILLVCAWLDIKDGPVTMLLERMVPELPPPPPDIKDNLTQNDMKKTTQKQYERKLKDMVKARTGKECEPWLLPQIMMTANSMVLLDRFGEALEEAGDLTSVETGSMGQTKTVVNPLVPYYDKLQRTLLLQLESLGLNYNTTPSKVTENTKQGGKEQDVLQNTLNIAMEGMRNEDDV